MKRSSRTSVNHRVRQLCQHVSKEVDREKLQDLISQLQAALNQNNFNENPHTIHVQSSADLHRHDSPFDKILPA